MLNRVTLVGRITKDPELRQAGANNCCNFTLAVGRRFVKEGQQDTDFINCVTWGQSANFLHSYIKKGYLLSVEGKLQTRSYDGQNGKVYVTEVLCESVENLTPRNSVATQQQEQATNDNPYETPESANISLEPDDLPFY